MSNVNSTTTKGIGLPPSHLDAKTYQTKANQAGGSELASWLEAATAYVSNVRAGIEPEDPNIPLWQYEQWIQQVSSQIYGGGYGGGWSPMMGGGAMGQPQVQAPPGAIVGADGNFIFDGKNADLIYDGNATQHVVNSTDVRLAVDSMGASYTFSMVADGTGEEVLKVVVDGPKGQQTYVFNNVNDDDFHLDLYAANLDNVDTSALPPEIQAKIAPKDIEELGEELATGGDVTLDGQPVEAETITEPGTDGTGGEYKYEADSIDQTFQLRPTAGPDNPTNYVVGNATISVPLSSTVSVTQESPAKTQGALEFGYKVVVTHSDGTKDTYYVQEGYNYQINAKEGSVSFDGAPDTDGAIPAAFQEAGFSTTASVEAGAVAGGAGADTYNAFIESLPEGKTWENVRSALVEAGVGGITANSTEQDIQQLFADGTFPPENPNNQLLDVLMILNDDLYEKSDVTSADAAGWEAYFSALLDQLEPLYVGHNFRHEEGSYSFSMDGEQFEMQAVLGTDMEHCRPAFV
jgi:hypothetical protein